MFPQLDFQLLDYEGYLKNFSYVLMWRANVLTMLLFGRFRQSVPRALCVRRSSVVTWSDGAWQSLIYFAVVCLAIKTPMLSLLQHCFVYFFCRLGRADKYDKKRTNTEADGLRTVKKADKRKPFSCLGCV